MKGIIILEGADCSGKSTLARFFQKHHGARVLHLRWNSNLWRYHTAAVRLAMKWADESLVVLDRSWLSELVYGEAMRGAPQFDIGARSFDRVLQRAGAINVLCVPSDRAMQVRLHAARARQGAEMFGTVEDAAQLYHDVAYGDRHTKVGGYLGHLIQTGGYAARMDGMIHDMSRSTTALMAERILDHLVSYRLRAFQPGLRSENWNLAGHLGTSEILFVGDRISPYTKSVFWPFFWSDAPGSTSYLNEALQMIDFDETKAMWVNAFAPDQHFADLARGFRDRSRKIIALGTSAGIRLRTLDCRPTVELPHPKWWRRFEHNNMSAYARMLKNATTEGRVFA